MKLFLFFGLLTVSLIITDISVVCGRGLSQSQAENSQQTDEFLKRWNDERLTSFFPGSVWTLTHDYSDYKRVEEVLNTFKTYFQALEKYEKGDQTSLNKLGGIKSFKDKMAALLMDDDQAIRAFAAIMVGISGDRAYMSNVAMLLKRTKHNVDDLIYDRGSAALALGLLEAKEYASDLVSLLQSHNISDRLGAARGLGWMKDKDQAKAVAVLLNDEDENVRQAAVEALEMMGATELIKK